LNAASKRRLVFFVKFVIGIAIAIAILSLAVVDTYVVRPFSVVQTNAAAMVLRVARQDVHASGTFLTQAGYAVDVKNGCNGIEALALLVVAIGAFPASWRARVLGMVTGGVLLIGVNIVRIVSLFVILRDYPKAFEFSHVVVWQVLLFLLVVAFFVKWSSRYAEAR
jgi:exosortase H (IPTLxxWG-CTERM-specific)